MYSSEKGKVKHTRAQKKHFSSRFGLTNIQELMPVWGVYSVTFFWAQVDSSITFLWSFALGIQFARGKVALLFL